MSQYDLLLGPGQLKYFFPALAFLIHRRIDNINDKQTAWTSLIIECLIYFISFVLELIVNWLMLTLISSWGEDDNEFLLDCSQIGLKSPWIVAICKQEIRVAVVSFDC